jgi:hypothetical protein
MSVMNPKLALLICVMLAAFAAGNPAQAQMMIPPGASPLSPPPPPPPPPPKIEVPVMPKMDAMPRQVRPSPRDSFSDRITNCLHEGAAAGLGPNERAAYSRSCANR